MVIIGRTLVMVYVRDKCQGCFEVVSVRNPEDLVFQLSINDSVSLMIYLQLLLDRTTKRPKMVVKQVTQELASLHGLSARLMESRQRVTVLLFSPNSRHHRRL